MEQATALVGPALTITLVLTRPGLGPRLRVTPAIAAAAGVCVMMLLSVIHTDELVTAVGVLWRPFLGVAAIMVTAAVAETVGLLERAASYAERATTGAVWVAFAAVFGISAAVATLFNNDAAILVLTPVIVKLVKRRYPKRTYLTTPFAFAVFSAAGVAPLVISNPINMIVASTAGIGFNAYALVMIPVAAAGLLAAFAALCFVFRKEIWDSTPASGLMSPPPPPMSQVEKQALLVMAGGLGLYPIVSLFDGPVWIVSLIGAAAGVWVAFQHGFGTAKDFAKAVAWDVLFFLFGVFVMAQGLRNTGTVAKLTSVYSLFESSALRVWVIGTVSALGSALLNNHPMAILNALAVADVPNHDHRAVLAALIGGDLGPRLLPMGSLAGLLWIRSLARYQIDIHVKQFVKVGATLTVPALFISLLVLLLVG